MKRFVRRYVKKHIPGVKIETDRKGNLYLIKGVAETYPCIVAHLDQVQREHSKDFIPVETKELIFGYSPRNRKQEGLGADDKNGMTMVQNTKAGIVTYSCRTAADHTCRIIEESFDGMQLSIDGKECWTSLIGQHNAYNILAIYTAAICLGAGQEETLIGISKLKSAPGRLETVRGPRDLSAIIDYAHTPDALENVLKTLREIASGRELICLFGCGGDRDKTKRPEMAAVAQKYADRIIVTSDNSRTERTEDIMADIRAGMDRKGLAKSLFIADSK